MRRGPCSFGWCGKAIATVARSNKPAIDQGIIMIQELNTNSFLNAITSNEPRQRNEAKVSLSPRATIVDRDTLVSEGQWGTFQHCPPHIAVHASSIVNQEIFQHAGYVGDKVHLSIRKRSQWNFVTKVS